MSHDRVVVIGGGIIGTSCAYYLAKKGWKVTLVDRDRQGRGASSGNCGLLSFSHVLPLHEPGAIREGIRALWDRNAALTIRPRLDPDLWFWLWKFARRCNGDAMLESARGRAALLGSSAGLFPELVAEESIDCEWERNGCLFVYQTQAAFEAYRSHSKLIQTEFGIRVEEISGTQLMHQESSLKPGAAVGAWFYPDDSHLRPDLLLTEWRKVLERLGVEILEGCSVRSFDGGNGRARKVITDHGNLEADAFVAATGAMTSLLARELGCRIPIQPGKGYSITMARPSKCPRLPMILQEQKVVVTPLRSAYRLGSTMEFTGYDDSLNSRRLSLLRQGAAAYLKEPTAEPVEEEWCGWRPMTYDGKPILDRSPGFENVFVGAGHNMLGLSMAPATGKLMAELVSGEKPHLDPAHFSVSRFQ